MTGGFLFLVSLALTVSPLFPPRTLQEAEWFYGDGFAEVCGGWCPCDSQSLCPLTLYSATLEDPREGDKEVLGLL